MRLLFVALLLSAAPAWALDPTSNPYVASPTDAPVVFVGPFQQTWGVALRGGAALPLGKQSADNSAGGMTGLDAFFQATQKIDIDFMGLYAEMPYTAAGGGSSTPLTDSGVAVKLDYQVFSNDQSTAWLGLGLGYMDLESTQHLPEPPVLGVVSYSYVPQNSGGIALLACAGMNYEFYPQWTANLELVAMSLDSVGGTSNNLLVALPDLFVKWMY